MPRPKPTAGLRHVALQVVDLESCEKFYTDLMGMEVEWRPDKDNVYLTSGNDNLALHRVSKADSDNQKLDHIGFFINEVDQVEPWYDFLKDHDVPMKTEVCNHRDGARSFYCYDPEGTTVQIIYHPPIAKFDAESSR